MNTRLTLACYSDGMMEFLTLLSIYYNCTALAEQGLLTRSERIECNASYQQVKRHFVGQPTDALLSHEQNVNAYRKFKSWEAENAQLVQDLKSYAAR
ncbi:MAG: hypothetical protein AAGF55_09965 [Pseudomonadota bacterium]